MTEQSLENAHGESQSPPGPAQPGRLRWTRWSIAGAVAAFVLLGLTLTRTWLVESVGGAVCAGQGLRCTMRVTRFDFGGVSLADLKVSGAKAAEPVLLSAGRVAVDFAWSAPWSTRAAWVGADDLVVRLDLREGKPLLGDLDALTKGPKSNAPPPRLDAKGLKLLVQTEAGVVEAAGRAAFTAADTFDIDLKAQPGKLVGGGAELDLAGAALRAKAAGGKLDGVVNFDLRKYSGASANLADVKLDADFRQAAGVFRAAATASADALATKQGGVVGASAKADIEAAALDLSKLTVESFLLALKRASVDAHAGKGSLAGAGGWSGGQLSARIDPRDEGGAGGQIDLKLSDILSPIGAADALDIGSTLELPAGVAAAAHKSAPEMRAKGVVKVTGASLDQKRKSAAADAVAGPLQAVLPAFAAAASIAARKAGDRFELFFPWSVKLDDKGAVKASALPGTSMHADSGMAVEFAGGDRDGILTLNRAAAADAAGVRHVSLTAAGDMHMSGGGAPPLTLHVIDAGWSDGGKADASFSLSLEPWRVGADEVSASLANVAVHASGLASPPVALPEPVAGAASSSTTSPAPSGAPAGDGPAIVAAPLGMQLTYACGPAKLDLKTGDAHVVGGLAKVSGAAAAAKAGWTAGAVLSGADARLADILIDRGQATIAASGGHGGRAGLDVHATNVAARISDDKPPAERRFETMTARAQGRIQAGKANFSGAAALSASGVQLASFSGTHDLETGAGHATLAKAPLIFKPGGFQPKAISPLLRAAAAVEGRVDIGGEANWSKAGPPAVTAGVELEKLGFTLASAGVFKGVSGRIDFDDVLKLKTPTGQKVTIDAITLGLPIVNGAVQVQLDGDKIRIESAEWPFAGGKLRVRPAAWALSGESNTLEVEAVGWDLAKLVELFKLSDVKLQGKVGGVFPVVVKTGSARINGAVLKNIDGGGVLQYTGQSGQAAGKSNSQAQFMFDVLKDYHFTLLQVNLDGDIAGSIIMKLTLNGRNPAVRKGEVNLNVTIDSQLAQLLQNAQSGNGVVDKLVNSALQSAGGKGN